MRFVEIELADGRRRRVNPDQVAYLVANQDDTATTLVFTGFMGGLLELQAKGSEDEVAALLSHPAWMGVDWAKPDPIETHMSEAAAYGTSFMFHPRGGYGKSSISAELVTMLKRAGGQPSQETPLFCDEINAPATEEILRRAAEIHLAEPLAAPACDRRPGAINLARDTTILPSKRAQRRAAGKAARTPKGKS